LENWVAAQLAQNQENGLNYVPFVDETYARKHRLV
jgi:hypothetical protein